MTKIKEIIRLRFDTYECHRHLFFVRRFIINKKIECFNQIDSITLKRHYDRLKNSEIINIEDDRMESLIILIETHLWDKIEIDEISHMESVLLNTLHNLSDMITEKIMEIE